jgi:putative transposase
MNGAASVFIGTPTISQSGTVKSGIVTDNLDPTYYPATLHAMPSRLKRYYGAGDFHFITCSCYQRRPLLAAPHRRDLFLEILEHAREDYRFIVIGYVVMPEHFHLLISEPEKGDPSVVMKVVKQRFSHRVLNHLRRQAAPGRLWANALEQSQVWQRRFYDYNVRTEQKRVEKLRYIHRNPVKRGLVAEPDQWAWSSYRAYAYGEPGLVRVNEQWPLVLGVAEAS